MSGAELTFGLLTLLSDLPAAADYTIDAGADDTNFGNPEATVAAVASMLMDGDRAQITRYGNRQATIKVSIKGATLDAVARGTAAIEAEVNRGRNTLTWLPPGWSTASVFDVVYSTLDFNFDDLAETMHVTRYFTLTLTCLPFARRADRTVTVATPIPAGTPTWVTVDDCTSTTGWAASGTGSPTVTTSGGAVRWNRGPGTKSSGGRLTRTGLSAVVPAGGYLVIDAEVILPIGPPTFQVNGATLPVKATSAQDPTSGGYRSRYYVDAGGLTVASVDIAATFHTTGEFLIHDVSHVTQLPFQGTRQQRSFTVEVAGTARTAADVDLEMVIPLTFGESPSDLLLFTAPTDAAIAPPMRRYLTVSATADSSDVMMSGAYHPLTTQSLYAIPTATLPPGTHLIVARVARASGTGDVVFDWELSTNNTYVPASSDISGTATATALTTDFVFVELGIAQLPHVSVSGTNNLFITLTSPSGATALVDELYLFNIDTGVLTWLTDLKASTATASAYSITAATLDTGRPDWRAVGSTRSASLAERAKSPGVHEFESGLVDVFAVFPNALAFTTTVSYYERSRHHVPPLEV